MSPPPLPPPPPPPPPRPQPHLIFSNPSQPPLFPAPAPLYKQRSWSPDTYRDEAWLKRKGNNKRKNRRSKSVTDEDLDELKACIELGFGFDSPESDHQRLSDTLPALGLYYAVNKYYYDVASKSSSSSSSFSSSSSSSSFSSSSLTVSDCESPSPRGSSHTIIGPGDDPEMVKTRLKQWAQVVACSVRQSSC